jgi:hypothetical protein
MELLHTMLSFTSEVGQSRAFALYATWRKWCSELSVNARPAAWLIRIGRLSVKKNFH